MKFLTEHLGLPAAQPAALKDWYLKVLGATLVFENGQTPPAFFIQLPGGLLLEIYAAENTLAATGDNSLAGWRHLALQVESLEDAQAALAEKGVVFTEPVKPAGGGGRVLFFRDLEQNLLHLVERPKDSIFRR